MLALLRSRLKTILLTQLSILLRDHLARVTFMVAGAIAKHPVAAKQGAAKRKEKEKK